MSFIERNEAWNGSVRVFHQVNSRTTSPRVWAIGVEGNIITYTWGQLGGAMQKASEISQGVNLGKKNEMSPEAYALDRAREMARKKHWEGYREVHADGTMMDPEEPCAIDFDKPLPLNLSFYKPLNSAGSTLLKKADRGEALYTRKFNGMMHAIVRDSRDRVQIYSRRMLRCHDDEQESGPTWNARFSHIVSAAERFLPARSILLGELVVLKNGLEDFKLVQSYTKSLTPQSLEDQAKNGLPSFVVWDIAFWEGKDLVSQAPVQDRYDLIHEIDYAGCDGHIIPLQIMPKGFFKDSEQAVLYAKGAKWEGFVVVDPQGVYGDRAYNFKGKPDRPGAFCAKLKPAYEDDFIAMWDPDKGFGERSNKGRYAGGIKSVALFQYNSAGEFTFISNLNSGLTEQMKIDLAKPSLWPRVWKVEYTERTYISEGDDTNALTFARFIEERTDKSVKECVNPIL
jgi:predicted DNA-binding WGR domain protein